MEKEETNFEPEVVNGRPLPVGGPVPFLELIGQPDSVMATKANIRTLIDIVFPHYVSVFDDWWDNSEMYLGDFEGSTFSADIEDEDAAFEGETVYEWLLADFGHFIFT